MTGILEVMAEAIKYRTDNSGDEWIGYGRLCTSERSATMTRHYGSTLARSVLEGRGCTEGIASVSHGHSGRDEGKE